MAAAPVPPRRLAVVGHVEHVTIGRAPAAPRPGDIVHLRDPRAFAGGGGGISFWQLARSGAEVHLFAALGDDGAAAEVEAELRVRAAGNPRIKLHLARREAPQTRAMSVIDDAGERTILVAGAPLQPVVADPLPWDLLAGCDGVFFTAEEPAALRACREARVLVVTARRRGTVAEAGVRVDALVGSSGDAAERAVLSDFPVPPAALVMTEGARGGTIATAAGVERFPAPPPPPPEERRGTFGAGDSFAAALTWYLAAGLPVAEACARAGPHGAAILRGLVPMDVQLPLPG